MKILIIKTSSLGDIIQTFSVLNNLKARFPNALIDWAIEEKNRSVAACHPFIRNVLPLDLQGLKTGWRKREFWKNLFRSVRALRKEKYDLIFDFQANSKSALVTWLSRGPVKVGYGIRSVREWPNVLATNVRFEISKQMDIRLHYLKLVESYFNQPTEVADRGICFLTSAEERQTVANILSQTELRSRSKIMVCSGSKWTNKQLKTETMIEFLSLLQPKLDASFILVWGSDQEKEMAGKIQAHFPEKSLVIDKLSLPAWQNLMNEMDLVIAVDSSALHLCATTSAPSFSFFGPSNSKIFKPSGERHFAFQGNCPYDRKFEKTCPVLRSCPTGACMKNLSAQELFQAFLKWAKQESLF